MKNFCFLFVTFFLCCFLFSACGEIGHIGETDGSGETGDDSGSPDDPYKTADGQCRESFDICLFHFDILSNFEGDSAAFSITYNGGGVIKLRVAKSSGGVILDEVFSNFFNTFETNPIAELRKKEISITLCEAEFNFDTGTYQCVSEDPEKFCPGQPFECVVR